MTDSRGRSRRRRARGVLEAHISKAMPATIRCPRECSAISSAMRSHAPAFISLIAGCVLSLQLAVQATPEQGSKPKRVIEPLLLDLGANGFQLTSVVEGVTFDLTGDGTPEQMAWTAKNSDDAFLALDVTHTGRIEDGRKLLGGLCFGQSTHYRECLLRGRRRRSSANWLKSVAPADVEDGARRDPSGHIRPDRRVDRPASSAAGAPRRRRRRQTARCVVPGTV
jgi:hypothetical protein